MQDEVRLWVRTQMMKNRMKQDDLADLLGLSQAAISARLAGKEDSPPFKLHELDLLERHWGEPSPIRRASVQANAPANAIDPEVLRSVVRHLAKEYPKLISTDAERFTEALIALCEFVQQTNGRPLTRAESLIAMRSIAAIQSPNDRPA